MLPRVFTIRSVLVVLGMATVTFLWRATSSQEGATPASNVSSWISRAIIEYSNEPTETTESHALYKKCHGKAVDDVVYVKIQKTASTTLKAMILRYALKHNLVVCMDYSDIYHLNWPNKIDRDRIIKPRHRQCNIIADEMIYDKAILDELTNQDRKYITSVRHPIGHFVSAFNFVKMHAVLSSVHKRNMSFHDAMRLYLRDPAKVRLMLQTDAHRPTYYRHHFMKILRPNLQLFDLGIPSPQLMGAEELTRVIRSTLNDFSAVVVQDHFDESLILVKEALCWEYEDLIYKPRKSHRNEEEIRRPLPKDIEESIRNHNRYDLVLYNIIEREFKKTLAAIIDLGKKLTELRRVRDGFERKCNTTGDCLPSGNGEYFSSVQHRSKEVVRKRFLDINYGTAPRDNVEK